MAGTGGLDALRPEDPAQVGGYRLLARLGAGGMGRVYLGRDERGRTVAVKVVHPELARDPEFRSRFEREVAAARRVGGAWTAQVLDADTAAATPWLATAYVPGPTLRDAVGRHGPLPERSALALAAGLARALQAVHACGLVHRDLKPTNVLVTLDGPRVIDFGIARSLDATVATRTGALIGSPGFMSPEQVRGRRPTPASDVFCLGAVLAYAASGREPFGRSDSGMHAVMYRIVQEEPDLDGLPEPVLRVAEACLAKSPDERPRPDEILALLSAESGEYGEPWLPAAIAVDIGRNAARLLELEAPAHAPRSAAPPPYPPPPFATPPVRRTRTPAYLAAGALGTVLVVAMALAVLLDLEREPGGPAPLDATTSTATARQLRTDPSGNLPEAMVGAWEGQSVTPGTREQWTRRVILRQGRSGGAAGSIWSVTDDTLCESRLTLVSAGTASAELRSRTVRSVPAGACGDGSRWSMALGGDGTLNWTAGSASATLSKSSGDRVPERYRGRWWTTVGRPTAGSTAAPPRKTFEISGGAVGTEAVEISVTDGGDTCRAAAVLISVEPAIVFFSTRVLEGGCELGGMQRIAPDVQNGGLRWEALKQGQAGGLQRG
ncbi:serine/threonine-protein kinase [Spirillospora sp. NPDC029432]|uniref:serine/threonine-protein kinase n=1 Tax=Spirillospora sp. NPDC029432 TaxID=3154599 RepID=UPI003455DEF8